MILYSIERIPVTYKALLICVFLFLPASASANCHDSSFTEARTVWVDANFAFRKKGGAKVINKIHQDMEAEGWGFQDMEPYTENGDLEGFFITYTRNKLITTIDHQTDSAKK